jgi:hypothetical protein
MLKDYRDQIKPTSSNSSDVPIHANAYRLGRGSLVIEEVVAKLGVGAYPWHRLGHI